MECKNCWELISNTFSTLKSCVTKLWMYQLIEWLVRKCSRIWHLKSDKPKKFNTQFLKKIFIQKLFISSAKLWDTGTMVSEKINTLTSLRTFCRWHSVNFRLSLPPSHVFEILIFSAKIKWFIKMTLVEFFSTKNWQQGSTYFHQ